jgi:hypothetical protein
MLWWILACGGEGASDAHLYQQGLQSGDCGSIREVDYRDDCFLMTASKRPDDPCGGIQTERMRDDCWFQTAEKRRDAGLCAKAGSFREDCALHLLSSSFGTSVIKGTRPGEHEEAIEKKIVEAGLEITDPRPWSAYYRWVLGGIRPLDRSLCRAVSDPMRQEACLKTGVAAYNDLLNYARDTHVFPCPKGSPLPKLLQYAPDPELDALIAGRTDLCP